MFVQDRKVMPRLIACLACGALACRSSAEGMLCVGRAFSEDILVERPTPEEEQQHAEREVLHIVAAGTMTRLREMVRAHVIKDQHGPIDEPGGIERYASHVGRMAGLSEEDLSKRVEIEKQLLRTLRDWHIQHGERTPPIDEALAAVHVAFPTSAAIANRVDALSSLPPAMALFGATGKGVFFEVLAARTLRGAGSLVVGDEEMIERRKALEEKGFRVPADEDIRLDIKIGKARRIIDEYILEEIAAKRIVIFEEDVRQAVVSHLSERTRD